MTPLETTVRARLREAYRSLDEAALIRMVDEKTSLVLPVLREGMDDNATPSLDRIHLAELEATKRKMRNMIGQMTDPVGQGIQDRAQKELDATPEAAPAPDPMADELERRLAELEARVQGTGSEPPKETSSGC
jgi:hypothetical protein